ncbi:MAG: hypothetical protein ACO3XJ_00605 [Candidatus Nanopelagicales bacterium]
MLRYQNDDIEFECEIQSITAVIGGATIESIFTEIVSERENYLNGNSIGTLSADNEFDSKRTLGDLISKQFKKHKKVSRKRSLQAIEEILQFLKADSIVDTPLRELSELQIAHTKLAYAIALRPEVVIAWTFLSTMSAPVCEILKTNIAEIHRDLHVGFILFEKRVSVVENLAENIFNFHPEKVSIPIERDILLPIIQPKPKSSSDEISGLDFVSG